MGTNYDEQLNSSVRHERISGSFSVGGNDSDKYIDNYERIFGSGPRDKKVSERFRTKKQKPKSNIVIKVR